MPTWNLGGYIPSSSFSLSVSFEVSSPTKKSISLRKFCVQKIHHEQLVEYTLLEANPSELPSNSPYVMWRLRKN